MLNAKDMSTESESRVNGSRSTSRGRRKTLKERQDRTLYLPPGRRFSSFSSDVQESILKNLQEKIQQILKHHPEGICIPEFLTAYKKEFGKQLDVHGFGFSSYTECFGNIPGMEIVERHNRFYILSVTSVCKQPMDINGNRKSDESSLPDTSSFFSCMSSVASDFHSLSLSESVASDKSVVSILPPVPLSSRCSETSEVDDISQLQINVRRQRQPSGPKIQITPVPQREWKFVPFPKRETRFDIAPNPDGAVFNKEVVIYRIRRLLKAHVHGIQLKEIHHTYLLHYDDDFVPQDFGFNNMADFMLKIADDVPLKIMDVKGMPTVFYYIDMQASLPPPLPDPVVPLTKAGIPIDAITSGGIFEQQKMYTVLENQYFPIEISYIQNPGCFWIRLRGKGTTEALSGLRRDLDKFYKDRQGNFYIMRDRHIIPNAICAALELDGNWHRCVIIKASPDSSSVRVFYVDFGDEGDVQKSDLRYLRQRFLALPSQAIKARLAFLQPRYDVMNTWDKRGADKMIRLCLDSNLRAQICRNITYPEFLSLWIWHRTAGGNKVYWNKLMVDEGLAEFAQDEIQKASYLPCCFTSNPHFRDLMGISRLSGPHEIFNWTIPSPMNFSGSYPPHPLLMSP